MATSNLDAHRDEVWKRITEWYLDGGTYGLITQLQHALQCAYQAKLAKAPVGVIVGGLLHDIGWKLSQNDPSVDKGEGQEGSINTEAPDKGCIAEQLGILNFCGNDGASDEQLRAQHDVIGATWLRMMGFKDVVPHVAEGHVLAKRYLVFAESDYYEKLSSVSKRTLEFQGGPMNESEAKIFKADPNFGTCIEMRRWDEGAKQPIWKVDDLASYEQMVKQCIVYPLSKPLPSRTFLRTGNVIVGLGSGRDCDDGERATKKLKTEPTTVEVWNPVIPSIPVLRSPRQTQLMADWATKGFAVIKRSDWLSEDECNDLVAQCDGVSSLKASATTDGVGPFHTFEASQVSDFKPMPSRTEAFVDHHPKLKEFLCGPSSRLQAIASHLAGEQTALYKDKLNYKLAGGGGYRPHQDGYQGLGVAQYKSKADRGFVTCVCMVAIDDSDETNGCPQLSPEVWAKKEGFLKIKDPNNNEEMGPFTPIPMKRGDVLIYDNFMPHKSDSNASLRDRRALFGVYYGAETTKRDLRTEYYQAEANNRRKQNSSAIDGKANIYHTGTPAANPV